MFPYTVPQTTPVITQSGCTAKLLPLYLHVKQEGSLYHFYDGLWYDPAGAKTEDQLQLFIVVVHGTSGFL